MWASGNRMDSGQIHFNVGKFQLAIAAWPHGSAEFGKPQQALGQKMLMQTMAGKFFLILASERQVDCYRASAWRE